jgi:AcrR family transcriptional regulator
VARKVGVTLDSLVAAATAVADRDGLPALSLSPVAAALGVRPPSLYAHVDGLDGLRRELGRTAGRELGARMRAAADEAGDPVAALTAIGRAYRTFARAHPGLYAALLPVPRADEDPEGAAAVAAPVEVLVDVLTALGVEPGRHVDLIRALRAMLHGFVDLENGRGFGYADPVDASFDVALDLVVTALVAQRGTAP